jgi:protein phosphatase
MTEYLHVDRPYYDQAKRLLAIPRPTLIILCGPSGCGKSTFANTHFQQTSIVSTDTCRSLVSDDIRNMECSGEAFDLAYTIVNKRLKLGRTTVFDSTALSFHARQKLREIAHAHDFMTLLLVLNTSKEMCMQRDGTRIWPTPVGKDVLNNQFHQFQDSLATITQEGDDGVAIISNEEVNKLHVRVEPLNTERPEEHGPFDIIGDVHGCLDELRQLLGQLGYLENSAQVWRHPDKRRVIFLGNLVDRGPNSLEVLRLVAHMVKAGQALYVQGDHCNRFYRYINQQHTILNQGLETTVAEFMALPTPERAEIADLVKDLIGSAPSYLLLDNGKLAVAHAGVKDTMLGRLSDRIFYFCLYGHTTNNTNVEAELEHSAEEIIVPENWAEHYRGKPLVAYAHTPLATAGPEIHNNTVNLDQGCVFGGRLAAMRYPERSFVQVKAAHSYYPTTNVVSLAG